MEESEEDVKEWALGVIGWGTGVIGYCARRCTTAGPPGGVLICPCSEEVLEDWVGQKEKETEMGKWGDGRKRKLAALLLRRLLLRLLLVVKRGK